MAVLLLIETATPVCSVALSKDSELLALRESREENIHSSLITVFMQEICEEAGLPMPDIDGVAVSKGPGSYTGLRIGVSAAKGFCYALDKPLIAISTLQSMADGARQHLPDDKGNLYHKPLLCPMIDARRMEVYTAVYDTGLNEIMGISAKIIDENSFSALLSGHPMYFFGNGAGKCRDVLAGRGNANFIEGFVPSSKHMIGLAEHAYLNRKFEDVAYFEPYYLKDFIAGKPRVKGLE
jgi:tRNA threonylcarbamoyladenosine biosynthesis protein TsaB